MKRFISTATLIVAFCIAGTSCAIAPRHNTLSWPKDLPKYDHIVIVLEENKDYDEIHSKYSMQANYINTLASEGANFTQMFGEEHNSQGNYYWLFSGDNQNVGFFDQVPTSANKDPAYPFQTSNLAYQLIQHGYSFKGYSEGLPQISSQQSAAPDGCDKSYATSALCVYARKHVPWISFANVPNGNTMATSSNLRFADFPKPGDYDRLPTVSFIIPNLNHDMHNCFAPSCTGTEEQRMSCCIDKGDDWLEKNLDSFYQWAKEHNSLLILTFDENNDKRSYKGLTNPMITPKEEEKFCDASKIDPEYCNDLENKVVTIFAGAHIKKGDYPEGIGITHVNILRTIEAMYGLPKSGRQQTNAAGYGISDNYLITDVFEKVK